MAKKSTNPLLDVFSVFDEEKGYQVMKMQYVSNGAVKTTLVIPAFTSSVDGAKHVLRQFEQKDKERVFAHARALAEHYINQATNTPKWTAEQKAEASAKAKADYAALSDDEKARRKELAKANAERQFGLSEVPEWMTTK